MFLCLFFRVFDLSVFVFCFFRGERAMLAIRQTDVNTLLAYFFNPGFRTRITTAYNASHSEAATEDAEKEKAAEAIAPAASPNS